MNTTQPPTPDDPRLTAYALGELPDSERPALEASLRLNPALQAEVEAIRAAAATLTAALAAEPAADSLPPYRPAPARPAKRLLAFPQLYYLAGGLAVAGFAVLVTLYRDTFEAKENARAEARRLATAQRPIADPPDAIAIHLGPHATQSDPASRSALPGLPPSLDFRDARQHPVSTFPLITTGDGLQPLRRALDSGRLPAPDTVRIADLLRHFTNRPSSLPPSSTEPVAVSLEIASAPWTPAHRLVRIDLQTRRANPGDRSVPAVSDVDLQVEFDPAQVASHRLLGYEHIPAPLGDPAPRAATSLPSDHVVTALYEIVPTTPRANAIPQALLTVRVHYREQAAAPRRHLAFPLLDRGESFATATADFRFAAAVASFGMILRHSPHAGSATLRDAIAWATPAPSIELAGLHAEFLDLARQAQALLE